jgi:hypothetical protein
LMCCAIDGARTAAGPSKSLLDELHEVCFTSARKRGWLNCGRCPKTEEGWGAIKT